MSVPIEEELDRGQMIIRDERANNIQMTVEMNHADGAVGLIDAPQQG